MNRTHAETDVGTAEPTPALLGLLAAITVFGAVSIEMYLPAVPKIAADLHAWRGGVEMTISTFLIALAVGQLIYGPMSDRFGRRPPLLVGLVLYCAASIACALAQDVDQLIVFRFLQALGGCAGAVIVRAVIRDRFPGDRLVHILSMMSLIVGLAPLLSPLAGAAILRFGSWRAIMWVQAAYGIAVAVAAALFLRESAPRLNEPARDGAVRTLIAGYRTVLTSRRTVGYALTQGFSGAVIFVYGAAFPAAAMQRYGLSPAEVSWVLAGSAGCMMACAQLNRPLLHRFASDQILKAANLGSIALSAVLCLTAWTEMFGIVGQIVPLMGIMALRGISMPNSAAAALSSQKLNIGAVSAVVGAQGFAWGAALSALSARFTDGTSRPMAATILLSTVLAAVVLRGVALPTSAGQASAVRS